MVAITVVKLEENGFPWRYMKYVSEERQSRILAYKNTEDKKRSLLSGLLIGREAIEVAKIPFSAICLAYNLYGKPEVVNAKQFHFNLSHSASYVVLASSKCPIGIDIEQIKKIDLTIAKRFFTDREYRFLQRLSEPEKQIREFYRLWTLKESYIKAVGKGLKIPLNSFSFNERCELEYTGEPVKQSFRFHSTAFSGYALSVCSLEKYSNFELQFITECDLYAYFNNLSVQPSPGSQPIDSKTEGESI